MRVRRRDPTKGILDFAEGLRHFQLKRLAPAPDLRPWIDAYWIVAWDLPPGMVHRQVNLSHASINAVIESGGTLLYGVPQRTFVRDIEGTDSVFGVKFRPGGFYPFHQTRLGSLTGKRIPLEDLLGKSVGLWAAAMKAEGDPAARAALADTFWLEIRQHNPSGFERAPRPATLIAEAIMSDRGVLTVAEAARRAGVGIRSLERLFVREVGIGPKEVIRRFRLQEAADRLMRQPDVPCGEIAQDLGYADQAHFIRDFKTVVGVSPEVYRQRQHP